METPRGLFRRNRRHIQHTGYDRPNQPVPSGGMDEPIVNQEDDDRDIQPDEPPDVQPSTGASKSQMTRSGRMIVKPTRFDDFV